MGKPTRRDLLTLGLPAPAAVLQPTLVEQVDAATGLLTATAHGLFDDDVVSLQLLSSTTLGADPSVLPAGLEEGTPYYVRPATADAFRLATAASPATAITSFADEGEGSFQLLADNADALDRAIDDAWTTVHAMLTAHGGDVEAPIVTLATRYLAAQLYIAHCAIGDPAAAQSYGAIGDLWSSTYKPLLDRYLAGIPVRGATDATPTVSEGSPRFVRLGPAASTSTSWGTESAEVV